jgi:hypothetical protein
MFCLNHASQLGESRSHSWNVLAAGEGHEEVHARIGDGGVGVLHCGDKRPNEIGKGGSSLVGFVLLGCKVFGESRRMGCR